MLNRAVLNVGWHRIQVMPARKAARPATVEPSYTSKACAFRRTVDAGATKVRLPSSAQHAGTVPTPTAMQGQRSLPGEHSEH